MLSHFSHVHSVTAWTVAHQAPLSMGILQARILEWDMPSPGDIPEPGVETTSPDPGMESTSLCLLYWQAGSLPLAPPGKPSLVEKSQIISLTSKCLECLLVLRPSHHLWVLPLLKFVSFLYFYRRKIDYELHKVKLVFLSFILLIVYSRW